MRGSHDLTHGCAFTEARAGTVCTGLGRKSVDPDVVDKSSFEPFIIDAQVSFIGSSETVNVKVLRDTGVRHSFIVQLVLPFSSDTQSGDFSVMHGIELGYVPVLRHMVVLKCDLVRGVFSVAARPALPLPGMSMILGNYICFRHV